jgi:hypothetical protein
MSFGPSGLLHGRYVFSAMKHAAIAQAIVCSVMQSRDELNGADRVCPWIYARPYLPTLWSGNIFSASKEALSYPVAGCLEITDSGNCA